MPLLTRKVDYAILVLNYLHHNAEGGCAREIADRYRLSRAIWARALLTAFSASQPNGWLRLAAFP